MIKWEQLKSNRDAHYGFIYRAKVPGGWLVHYVGYEASGLTFYPDPQHKWDGTSPP